MKSFFTGLLGAGILSLCSSTEAHPTKELKVDIIAKVEAGELSAREAHQLISKSKLVLLDVRTDWEFASGHLENAIHIPLQLIESGEAELSAYKGKTVIVYCRSGRRSGIASHIMAEQGLKAYNLVGGIIAWNGEGFNVVK